MMDLFFTDPEAIPLPPEEVRIQDFSLEPWPDGRRVRVMLMVDPFQQRPSVEIFIRNDAGQVVAEAMVVESISRKIELNLHLRPPDPTGRYRAQAVLFYQKLPDVNDDASTPVELPERLQVDSKERSFEITL